MKKMLDVPVNMRSQSEKYFSEYTFMMASSFEIHCMASTICPDTGRKHNNGMHNDNENCISLIPASMLQKEKIFHRRCDLSH